MTVSVSVHNAAELPAELAAALAETLDGALSPERAERLWRVERALWTPRVLLALAPQPDTAAPQPDTAAPRLLGAALTAGRAGSAYRKVVDIAAADDTVWRALLEAALADVPDPQRPPVVVHVEEHPHLAAFTPAQRATVEELGCVAAAPPVPSIPSTRAGDPAEVRVFSRWRSGAPDRAVPYFGQTTEVTCGAVAGLMAFETAGASRFDPERLDRNRAAELGLWRRANNLPACTPLGLAVELAKDARECPVVAPLPELTLSVDGPILLEFASDEAGRRLRVDLQNVAAAEAEQLGLPVETRWMPVAEIRERLAAGNLLLLLIDLTELIDDPTPHWVLASGLVDGCVLVSDPWVDADHGESWADTFALPLPLDTVDRVTRWGDPAYRGVITLTPSGS